jgi:hypothetical protein
MAEEHALKEYAIPSTEEPCAIIVYPTVEGENFEIKPAQLKLVQQNYFSGSPDEDPNLHISIFWRLTVTYKANQEAIRLHLFPFSLKDRALTWFHSLRVGSITSWGQMRREFLARFFPPSKIARLRAKLYQFTQKEGESLYDSWKRYKEMLRLCPHHGLESLLIIHTFYNGLSYATKISVDAAAGDALMNKDFKTVYALIGDMALNLFQWTDKEVVTKSSPSKRRAGMYEVSNYDHLAAKIDALTHNFEKLNVSAITYTSTPPSCETCGERKLGSVEQINFIQNNKGTAPPSYANVQRVIQKSNLELLLENYLFNQFEQLRELEDQTRLLTDTLATLTSKVDSISSHNKILETQLSQVIQKVSHPKTDKMNAITLRSGRQLEDNIRKAKPSEVEREISEPQREETRVESEEPQVVETTPPPFKPKIPFPQRFAKSKLDEQFKKFIEMMNKIYVDVPFTEVLTQMPTYAKFLKEILSKKRKIEEGETVNLTEECSAIIQNKLPPKLKDPGSFSIPCVIGSEIVKKAMCDLGASVSLMPLSLYERLGIGELKSTRMSLQLADRSVQYPAGIIKDVPVKVGEIYVPTDFVVMEMEEDNQIPILLGRPFLATAGAIIDVKHGKLAFNVGKETVEFELAKLMKNPSIKDSCCMLDIIECCVKE